MMITRTFLKLKFLILIVLFSGVVLNVFAKPVIHFQEDTYDFGEVEQGKLLKHIFSFENLGDEPLFISEVRNYCRCTESVLSSEKILPGQTGQITVTFDTEERQGRVFQPIGVYSSDSKDEPLVKLYLKGFIKTDVIVEWQEVHFPQFCRDNPSKREVYLLKGSSKDFKILKVEADSEYIDIYGPTPVFKEDLQGVDKVYKKGHLINVSLKPNVPIGEFAGNLKVHTDSNQQPVITIAVVANVIGKIGVEPGSVTLLSKCDKSFKSVSFKFFSILDNKVKVTEIKNNLEEYISVELKGSKTDALYEILVTLKDNISEENIRGNITIVTNYKEQPYVVIPVNITHCKKN